MFTYVIQQNGNLFFSKRVYLKFTLGTLREIINRWAPPNENDTDAYVRSVCQRIGLAEYQRIPMGINPLLNPLLNPIIKALIHHELGCQPYSDWLIVTGITWEKEGVPHRIKQQSVLIVINLLVLGFLFGERAIKNVAPYLIKAAEKRQR